MRCKPCKQNPETSQLLLWGILGVIGASAIYYFVRKSKYPGEGVLRAKPQGPITGGLKVYGDARDAAFGTKPQGPITGGMLDARLLENLPQTNEFRRIQPKEVRQPRSDIFTNIVSMLEQNKAQQGVKKDPLKDLEYAKAANIAKDFFLNGTAQAETAKAQGEYSKSHGNWIHEFYKKPSQERKQAFQSDLVDWQQKAILVFSNEPGQWVEMFWPEIKMGVAPPIILGLAFALVEQARKIAAVESIKSKAKEVGANEGAWSSWSDDKRLAVIRSLSV